MKETPKEFVISLKNLRFYSFHGVYEEERIIGNEFILNLSVVIPVFERVEEDNLEFTLSYADLYTIVSSEMARPRKLLETVAHSISNKIKEAYPQVVKGFVSIEKTHPPIPGMIGSAEVRINF